MTPPILTHLARTMRKRGWVELTDAEIAWATQRHGGHGVYDVLAALHLGKYTPHNRLAYFRAACRNTR